MSKQIYIDSNGNEIQVSGTVNTADMMPMSGNDSTKVSEAIGSLSTLTTTDKSSLVGAVNEVEGEIPEVYVSSVNGNSGAVTLTGSDIEYSSGVSVNSQIDTLMNYIPVYGNTASGAIATFDTSLALPLQDCTIAINAVQEGSGTPSPDNVRPITGFTGANIHVADDENPHVIDNVTPITWQSEAGTVYGGSLDVTSGVLTVTHARVDLGSLSQWNKNTSFTNTLFVTNVSGKKTNNSNCLCTNYVNGGIATGGIFLNNMQNNNFASDTSNGIYIRDDSKASLSGDDFKTAMSGVYLVYELATPQTYQLTPTQISAIVGTNNVFTDTNGDTSVVYACSLKDYIEGQ